MRAQFTIANQPASSTATPALPAVVAKNVKKSFGDVVAVNDVSLSIERGEVVAILGPNGAGKTTLLDMVLGLSEPTDGEVKLFGEVPKVAVKAGKVSALLQTGGLLQDMKVKEILQYIGSTFSFPTDPEASLALAGISHLQNRMIKKCSGGEQQRLKFALALLTKPELLILDEPTAGMDITSRRTFWDTMHEEASRAGPSFSPHIILKKLSISPNGS